MLPEYMLPATMEVIHSRAEVTGQALPGPRHLAAHPGRLFAGHSQLDVV